VRTGPGIRIAIVAAAVAVAAAAAILLNLALLGYAQPRSDPVGKLSPRAVLSPGPVTTTVPPPTVTVATVTGEADD
jgi:hypothetical protein